MFIMWELRRISTCYNNHYRELYQQVMFINPKFVCILPHQKRFSITDHKQFKSTSKYYMSIENKHLLIYQLQVTTLR